MLRRDPNWTVTTREDWRGAFELVDDETDAAIDLTGAALTITARRASPNGTMSDRIEGSTASGAITLPFPTQAEFAFPVATMSGLEPGLYGVEVIFVRDGETRAALLGYLNLVEGLAQ